MSAQKLTQVSTDHQSKPPAIFVVIPTLNEADSVGQVIRRCKEALVSFEHEIIVVDGSSTDGTPLIAQQLGATVLKENAHGYGAAYLTGFEYALQNSNDSIIIMIDADLTYPPEDIPNLIQPIRNDEAEMVLANRFANSPPHAMSFGNRIGNRLVSKIFSTLYGLKVQDSQTGFRAVTSTCLRKMYLEASGMPLATEMLIEARKVGARVVEVPTRYGVRVGQSKIRPLRDGYGIMWTSLRLVSELNPFIVYGGLALFFMLFGVGFGLYAFAGWYEWRFFGTSTWPRLGSALLSVLFVVAGTIVFSLGILLDTLLRHLRAASYRDRF